MIQILAEPRLPATEPGNALTLDASLIAPTNLIDDAKIAIEISVNDGQPATENSDEVPPTQLYFMMSLNETAELIDELVGLRDQAMLERSAVLEQALEFRSAQLACAKGQVGALEVLKVADSDRGAVGFGFYNLIYTDDSGDNTVIAHVKDIECYVPFIEEEQYEWLRTLVGGNHAYTTSIKIQLTGFNLEDIRNNFIQDLTANLEAQRNA